MLRSGAAVVIMWSILIRQQYKDKDARIKNDFCGAINELHIIIIIINNLQYHNVLTTTSRVKNILTLDSDNPDLTVERQIHFT